jgi:hypothetical protein
MSGPVRCAVYRAASVAEYVEAHTGGKGFDVVLILSEGRLWMILFFR